MKTQEIYQPVLISALLAAGGQATVRQLALALLAADEAQIDAAAARLKRMPLRVLRENGVIERTSKDVWQLTTPALSITERAQLTAASQARLATYLDTAGPVATAQGHVGTSLRKHVFEAALGRCLFCRGVTEELQVDHVQPQSEQGPTAVANLQALCKPCNIAKSIQWIDYRPLGHADRPATAPKGVVAYWDDKGVVWGLQGHEQTVS